MTRTRTIQSILGAAVAGAGVMIAPLPAHAATVTVACNENALVAAVNLANTTLGPDTLTLTPGCTSRLTSAHGGSANGLPLISTSIEMVRPATVTRDSRRDFRIAAVTGSGALTLTTGVAFTNGQANGSGGGFVTGNRADSSGGGIYNGAAATLTTTGLTMTGNTTDGKVGGPGAISSAATTLTGTKITGNPAGNTAGGVYRQGGVMTTTASPITANKRNNCVGSAPAVPTCTA